MKIITIICEFNPFHNGHAYLIDKARQLSGCDAVLCIMSGHFTQRGDRAVCDKFTRARHAVLGGADCVIELPAPFAVAPAQIFAQGAVKLAASVPGVAALAFGCESALDFKETAARANESGQFNELLKGALARGESYAKGYAEALKEVCGVQVDGPNNILAFEYAKAVLKYRPELQLVPVQRVGAGYHQRRLGGTYASASAIRAHLGDQKISKFVPPFVAHDLGADDGRERWEAIVKYALHTADIRQLEGVFGGGEGLGNRLKALGHLSVEDMVSQGTTRRYPSARISRMLTANALGFEAGKARAYLDGAGYIKPLAVRADRAPQIFAALAQSGMPVVITGSDVSGLGGLNADMYADSRRADGIWEIAAGRSVYDCTVIKV